MSPAIACSTSVASCCQEARSSVDPVGEEFQEQHDRFYRNAPDPFPRHEEHDLPPVGSRRSRAWIAGAVILAMLVAFGALLVTDDGGDGDSGLPDPATAPTAATT